MKKFLSAALVALIVTFTANICAANDYDNDPDYVYVGNAPSVKIYLNLRSVDVQEYNPPYYQIEGHFVDVWVRPDRVTSYNVAIRYNWYTKETYRRDEYGNWQKDDVGGSTNRGTFTRRETLPRKYADALFRAAYGMDFYGY